MTAGDTGEAADPAANCEPAGPEPTTCSQPVEAKKDIQSDIDKSVSEILACSSSPNKEAPTEQTVPLQAADAAPPAQSGLGSSRAPAVCQPSIQQLELLELEMRARAIKALMKASNGKRTSAVKNV